MVEGSQHRGSRKDELAKESSEHEIGENRDMSFSIIRIHRTSNDSAQVSFTAKKEETERREEDERKETNFLAAPANLECLPGYLIS